MRKLFLSMAVLAFSQTQAYSAGEPPPTSAEANALLLTKQLEASVDPDADGPPLVFVYPAQRDVPIEILVYDADGNLERAETMGVPCPPGQNTCPFTRTGLTPEETQEFFNERQAGAVFENGPANSDWSAFNTVP